MGEDMSRLTTALGLVAVALSASACVSNGTVTREATNAFDTSKFFDVSGNVSNPSAQTQPALAALMRERGWRITDVRVNVPRSLSTSEANTMEPNVELLWQDEPYGDRYAQA